VCGDLTSCFDFKTPNAALAELPATTESARRAATFKQHTTPPTPAELSAPKQASGLRRSRALPYRLEILEVSNDRLALQILNSGETGAVFHVHNLRNPDAPPQRYTVGSLRAETVEWQKGAYDIAIYGPNGFYRRYAGSGVGDVMRVNVTFTKNKPEMSIAAINVVADNDAMLVTANDYGDALTPAAWTQKLGAKGTEISPGRKTWDLSATHGWYDFTLRSAIDPKWLRRLAGRHETGAHGYSDPAMGGAARMTWDQFA
jgi:phospholipase C